MENNEGGATAGLGRRAIAVTLLLIVLVSGCAEHTVIRTEPAKAKVWFDDKFVGHSPANVRIERKDWKPAFKYRVEADGYVPEEGYIREVFGPGRLIGGIFSLGISVIFRRLYTVQGSYTFPLAMDPKLLRMLKQQQPAQAETRQSTAAKRLEELDRLKKQGTLTEDEYNEFRKEVLRDLSGQSDSKPPEQGN